MQAKELLHKLVFHKSIPVREIADAIGFSPAQLGRWIDGSSIPHQGVERHIICVLESWLERPNQIQLRTRDGDGT